LIDNLYFAGPLNLDRSNKTANTVMGTTLSLTAGEFDALDALATKEGEPVPLDKLKNLWQQPEAAKTGMSHIINQVGEAGEGFMWIEATDDTFTFHSRWGHNWKAAPTFTFMPQPPITEPIAWHKRASKKIFAGTALLAASVALFIVLIQARPPATEDYQIIYDLPPPLADTPFDDLVESDYNCSTCDK
jgi:hypothetical protein